MKFSKSCIFNEYHSLFLISFSGLKGLGFVIFFITPSNDWVSILSISLLFLRSFFIHPLFTSKISLDFDFMGVIIS